MEVYNKLVRDRIPEIIKNKGEQPVVHIADTDEYEAKLREKLGEEVAEFLVDWSVNEAADLVEVLYALCAIKGITPEQIETVRKQKATERGAFAKQLILQSVR